MESFPQIQRQESEGVQRITSPPSVSMMSEKDLMKGEFSLDRQSMFGNSDAGRSSAVQQSNIRFSP
jgi:hypothetical protein